MVDICDIIAFENGELTLDEIVPMFQGMIDDGTVWKLQGFYGRTAASLIERGLCQEKEDATSKQSP